MSTITTLNDGITGASFRGQVNTNFSNLNTDKLEATNLKTVNGNSLVGSGDIVISGGSGTLAGLTDVDIVTPANGEIISYNSTSSKWENVPLSGGGDMLASTYDPAGIAQQVAGLTATQTFSTGVKTFLNGILGLRNVANTFTSFFTNTNTASRTYTLQDSSDTLVGRSTTDILINKDISSSTNTYRSASLTIVGGVELATTAEINTGTDSTRAIPIDQYVASNRNVRYVEIVPIAGDADNAVGTKTGNITYRSLFAGTIVGIGAYVETAGTTGASVWDVNKNGTTIMTTNKLSIDSAETSTDTAATPPALTTTSIAVGDLITIDTDSLSTTKPKGLHVYLLIRLT